MANKKAHCQEAMSWLKNRGWSLAPLTGQDYPCLEAIAHCWAMYFSSDQEGRSAVIEAVGCLLHGCQEVCWPMARELIAQAGDWSHRVELWPQVVMAFAYGESLNSERVGRLERCHVGLAQVHP